jgi:hypothetical protein
MPFPFRTTLSSIMSAMDCRQDRNVALKPTIAWKRFGPGVPGE